VTEKDTLTMIVTVSGNTATCIDDLDTIIVTRVGTGSGIQGTWTMIDDEMGEATIIITASTLQMYVPKSAIMISMKAEFLYQLANPGITIDSSNAEVFKMTGNTSHEVVTISITDLGQMVWTSSVATHASLTTDLLVVTTCDEQEQAPVWLTDFISANATGTPKVKVLDFGAEIEAIRSKIDF
jgi:hypothetical protein